MAYIGKEFVHVREENVEELINAVGTSEGNSLDFLRNTCSQIVEKQGEFYKFIFKSINYEVVFQSGVPFNDVIKDTLHSTTTATVEGDTITIVQDFGSLGVLTSKREYRGDQLKVIITSDKWDGVAYRYYKA